eukprot:15684122-Heterocapsa_arctica.AAC.1
MQEVVAHLQLSPVGLHPSSNVRFSFNSLSCLDLLLADAQGWQPAERRTQWRTCEQSRLFCAMLFLLKFYVLVPVEVPESSSRLLGSQIKAESWSQTHCPAH